MIKSNSSSPDRVEEPLFRLRRVFNGTLMVGWQVLRDELPITFLFERHDDATAALNEFRNIAREALARIGRSV